MENTLVPHVALLDLFREKNLTPTRVVKRYDGTADLTWHVDDCDDRYVRATSSARGGDHVLVSRDLGIVESVVLADRGEIFDWVSSHLAKLSKSSLNRRHGAASSSGVA